MMIYIVEFLKNRTTGEWARSTNPASNSQYSTAEEAATALGQNPHSKNKTFEFRIRGEEVVGTWVKKPELMCLKCGRTGDVEIWLPWDASIPTNYNSHQCLGYGEHKGCGAAYRDEAAMRVLCGTNGPNTTTVQVSGSNSMGKEDKMFQVTVYNFATRVVSNALVDRLCAAKEELEKQVAGFRASGLTANKVFFTASILDTKTGKFHGFVSDAPPAIKLEGGE